MGNLAVQKCKAYNGKTPTAKFFNRYVSCISKETALASGRGKSILLSTPVRVNGDQPHEIYMYVRWYLEGKVARRYGFLVKKKGQRSAYKAAWVVACSPIHAEARAMREALRYIAEMNYYPCTFYTDSQKIATLSMQHQPPLMADWTVFKEIYEIWDIMKRNTYFHCVYLPREQNELAKKGRMEGPTWSNTGFTFPMFSD